ncbi:MAG TPA: glycosyltransferase [Opitutus sp.]|nr:glycosyltransferase [Opitutus sp.]
MKPGLKIAFFGSSLVSSYWNGAATYYRGLLRALARRGHTITFYEPDALGRQQHRDMPDPDWARVVVYPEDAASAIAAVESAQGADLLVKASGVGRHDATLEAAVLAHRDPTTIVAFWDVDAPATLDRLEADPRDPFHRLIPQYDLVLTYGGGPPVTAAYMARGARSCTPIYNALDPETHFPVPPDPHFAADLAFLGNRLPDREQRVDDFLLGAAVTRPQRRFLLGGSGWKGKPIPSNVHLLGHVGTEQHNAFNASPLAILNINRASMAHYGYSPATRIFEAAGAAACIVTDAWKGLELFLEPGAEVLVAASGAEVAALLDRLSRARARALGAAARRRVLASHTYDRRAERLEQVLVGEITSTLSAP